MVAKTRPKPLLVAVRWLPPELMDACVRTDVADDEDARLTSTGHLGRAEPLVALAAHEEGVSCAV